MIGKFLVLVETLNGKIVRAFTFTGRLDEALQAGVEKAYAANYLDVKVDALPVANKN